jgi:hypothetical protein
LFILQIVIIISAEENAAQSSLFQEDLEEIQGEGTLICESIIVRGQSTKNLYAHLLYIEGYGFMVFNATFNNISVISRQSGLLVEETGVPAENHRSVARTSLPYSRTI